MKDFYRFAALTLFFFSAQLAYSQAQPEFAVTVIEVEDFSSDINMSIYAALQGDGRLAIINSCDALGMVVVKSKDELTTRAELKSYLRGKLEGSLKSDSYVLRVDLAPMQVLTDCRAATQALYD